jgi:mannosyl-oligosaccharide alpha-1,2-mannosidase
MVDIFSGIGNKSPPPKKRKKVSARLRNYIADVENRPEAVESIFILYRITGNKTLQDAGWRMFQNIETMTRTEHAHAGIDDVRNVNTTRSDKMESFWLAETLKYFYLLFSEPSLVNLDEYVL